jgi:hypothetical protein
MEAELFGVRVVRVWNPLVLETMTAVLGAVALITAALSAQRAASVDPMEGLRGGVSRSIEATGYSERAARFDAWRFINH